MEENSLITQRLNKVFNKGSKKISLSKNEEITLLEFLYGNDTYFSEALTDDDFGLIKQSILDDTGFFSNMRGELSIFSDYKKEVKALEIEVKHRDDKILELETGRSNLVDTLQESRNKVESLKHDLDDSYDESTDQDKVISNLKDENDRLMKELVKLKLEKGETLTIFENKWLIDNIK